MSTCPREACHDAGIIVSGCSMAKSYAYQPPASMQVPESTKLSMIASYVFLQEGNIAEGEQRINMAIRHALHRCCGAIDPQRNPCPTSASHSDLNTREVCHRSVPSAVMTHLSCLNVSPYAPVVCSSKFLTV